MNKVIQLEYALGHKYYNSTGLRHGAKTKSTDALDFLNRGSSALPIGAGPQSGVVWGLQLVCLANWHVTGHHNTNDTLRLRWKGITVDRVYEDMHVLPPILHRAAVCLLCCSKQAEGVGGTVPPCASADRDGTAPNLPRWICADSLP